MITLYDSLTKKMIMRSFFVNPAVKFTFYFSVLPAFFVTAVMAQTSSMQEGNSAKQLMTISIPEEGLNKNEKLYIETIKVCYTLIQQHASPLFLHKAIKPVLETVLGDLSSSNITIEYVFNNDKNKSVFSNINISIKGETIRFSFNDEEGTVLTDVMIEYTDVQNPNNIKSVWFSFFDNGSLKRISYFNPKIEFINKISEWDEKGKLISNEVLQTPRPFTIKK